MIVRILHFALASVAAISPSFALGPQYQGYFPVLSPSASSPWVIGETNLLSWDIGWDAFANQLPPAFDVILHVSTSNTRPALKMITQVPLEALSVAVVLGENVPEGSSYRLTFSDSWSGVVFAASERFTISSSGKPSATPAKSIATATVNPTNLHKAAAVFQATLNGPHLPTGTETATGKVLGVTSAGELAHKHSALLFSLSGASALALLAGVHIVM